MVRVLIGGREFIWEDQSMVWKMASSGQPGTAMLDALNTFYTMDVVPDPGRYCPYPAEKLAIAVRDEMGATVIEIAPPEPQQYERGMVY